MPTPEAPLFAHFSLTTGLTDGSAGSVELDTIRLERDDNLSIARIHFRLDKRRLTGLMHLRLAVEHRHPAGTRIRIGADLRVNSVLEFGPPRTTKEQRQNGLKDCRNDRQKVIHPTGSIIIIAMPNSVAISAERSVAKAENREGGDSETVNP